MLCLFLLLRIYKNYSYLAMLLGLVINIKNMLINFTRSVSLIFGLLLFSSTTYAVNEAELILSSNHVLLMTGERQSQPLSVAITDQRIVWIGDHQTAKPLKANILILVTRQSCLDLLMRMVMLLMWLLLPR